jgi:molybdopterin molybdotransferase
MLTVAKALELVLASARPLPPARLALADSLGCVLAEDVSADLDLPPFDKSLVDGFAVRSADLAAHDSRLRVGEEIHAGQTPSRPLGPGEAAAIMTGAPLPEGADAVIMVEDVMRDGDSIRVPAQVVPGQFRLARGREMRAGEVVLGRGQELNPSRLGLLAAVGCVQPLVIPSPCVTILPTGDELVDPDRLPGPGQIRNSNAVMLQALVRKQGARARVLPIAPDEPQRLRSLVVEGIDSDVLLITGGVSAGQRDLVPETLASLGVKKNFHKVRLKPGKPLWFGLGPGDGQRAGPLVFGLPGNPVSGAVCFLLFVRPALERLAGRPAGATALPQGRLAAPFQHKGDRPTYHPARWDAQSQSITPLPWAGSADLRTVAGADGFAVFSAGDRAYDAGEGIAFMPFD